MLRLLAVLAFASLAALHAAPSVVAVRAVPATLRLTPGEPSVLRLQLEIAAPYHIYSPLPVFNDEGLGPQPTAVTVKQPGALRLAGPLQTSPAVERYDPNFKTTVLLLEGRAWIDVPLQLPVATPPGRLAAVLVVSYQACDDEQCLAPVAVEVPVTLEIVTTKK
jgi:hypothetical protein